MAHLTQVIAPFALKMDGGGIKEEQIHAGEKIAVAPKEVFFDDVFHAAGSKRRSIFLILRLLSREGHGLIQVTQEKGVNAFEYESQPLSQG